MDYETKYEQLTKRADQLLHAARCSAERGSMDWAAWWQARADQVLAERDEMTVEEAEE
jgi:HEPN domain-containing protein